MTPADQAYDAAVALKDASDLEGAANTLLQNVQEYPDHVLSYGALAVVLQRLDRKEEAVAHAIKVTELKPEDHFSFIQLSVICMRCGKIKEAEDAMAHAKMMQMAGGR